LGKVTDIARGHSEAIEQCYGCNTQVLGTNADTLLAQLPKDCVGCFGKRENIPSGKVVDGLDKRCMPLCQLAWLVPVSVDIRQPTLQLFYNGD
jgi:hypothetical protein